MHKSHPDQINPGGIFLLLTDKTYCCFTIEYNKNKRSINDAPFIM